MSQYLLNFAKENLAGKSDAYLALLWCMYKGTQDKGRYSDHIKLHLTSANNELLTTNYQRIAERFKRILDARPELDWIAPSGLRPLATLQVKNFRGFGAFGPEDKGTLMRFSKIKNIFYAPNGGGKSSLCEALEYATTGHIKEADRRKTKIKQYVARRAGKVELNLMGTDRNRVPASLTWSSCFIDRNRLQEFSLLGSKDTGSAESDVIATLFGLEEFQEVISRFVKPENFNLTSHRRPSQSEAVRTLEAARAELHEQRRRHHHNVSVLNDDVCARLSLRVDQQFAVRARHTRLTSVAEHKLRKAERLKVAEVPFAAPMKRILGAVRIARRLLSRKSTIDAAFLKNVMAINYRAVFEALQAIENAGASEHCPACSTPLARVVVNPFDKARRELATLNVLDQLKTSQQRVEWCMTQLASAIGTTITAIDNNARLGIPCALTLESLRASLMNFHSATDRAGAATQVLTKLTELLADDKAGVEAYFEVCRKKQNEIAQVDVQVKRLEQEAEQLKQAAEALRGLFDEKKASLAALKEIRRQLVELTRQRAGLQDNDADNTRLNAFIDQLQLEYGNLYRDLLGYKFSLEKARIAGIEGKAAEYYKAINHHDDDHERIDALSFEKMGETYRIKIVNADGSSLDAFSVLSEGHLRVLGLSLLLAMAEKNKFPLIVFDDVVNAIDSDHRSNIIDLFFADPYLRRTQMIITTHDRLFWERFCIIADRHAQSDQHSSCVLSYTNQGIVMVDHAGGFQEKVHRALGVYDIRQALIYCRIWFESMVLEYCLDNAVSVTAQFKKSALKKSIYLQLSLEKTFALVEPHIAYDRAHFDFIKQDLVNWGGQNQEHHAFDEGSLNFVHSKTSKEVVKIYDAIRFFECQLFTQKKQRSCNNLLADLGQKTAACAAKIAQLNNAPVEVQQAQEQRLAALQKRESEVNQELAYVGHCLAAQAAQGGNILPVSAGQA
jgi:DNA sulfur modification protein DndD